MATQRRRKHARVEVTGGVRLEVRIPKRRARPRKSPASGSANRSLGSGCWTRTSDPAVNSRLLYRLS